MDKFLFEIQNSELIDHTSHRMYKFLFEKVLLLHCDFVKLNGGSVIVEFNSSVMICGGSVIVEFNGSVMISITIIICGGSVNVEFKWQFNKLINCRSLLVFLL